MRNGLRLAAVLLVLVLACPLRAQDAKSAREFMLSAFHLYDAGGKGVPYSSGFYHTSLLALINADLRAAERSKFIPLAGTDLFCNCQERDGIWIQQLDVTPEAPSRGRVTVSFAVYAPGHQPDDGLRTLQYTLVREHGRWRVYDILVLSKRQERAKSKSFRRQLQDEILASAQASDLPAK